MGCRVARRLRDRRSEGASTASQYHIHILSTILLTRIQARNYMYRVHIGIQYMKDHLDVVVVGAGPVGLLTAVELALGGVRVLVLERLAAVSPITKALGIGPLGSEALQRRGMAG